MDNIVSDNFRFGQDNNIVVTLPQDVTIADKRQFSKPAPLSFRAVGGKESASASKGRGET